MAAVKSKNTKPELLVRKMLHANGYRFRLHNKDLPGKPDIVLKKHKAVIFVNGCFWHYHGCYKSKIPETNASFWREKLEKNRSRDCQVIEALIEQGWRVMVIWECSLKGKGRLAEEDLLEAVLLFLGSDDMSKDIIGIV